MSGTLLEDLDAARRGDREAAGRLIEENGGLIWSVARRYFGRGVEAASIVIFQPDSALAVPASACSASCL